MRRLKQLFDHNRKWASEITKSDPDFFRKLSCQQSPDILWIGCSDSRVPANQIIGLKPGEVFVHRNVANLVVHTDFNCLSVIQYAVEILKIRHIIVCGHYGCGGVRSAMEPHQLGLIDNWLRHVRDIYQQDHKSLEQLSADKRLNRLCELNVIEQVKNVCHTTIVQSAWRAGRELAVHGWIYDLNDGLLRDLNVCVENIDEVSSIYQIKPESL